MITYNPEIHKTRSWTTGKLCPKCKIPFTVEVCPLCGLHHSACDRVAYRELYKKTNSILAWFEYIMTFGVADREEFAGYEVKPLEERT